MAENKNKVDGYVLIDTKINTESAEKDLKSLEKDMDKTADAAKESSEKIEKSFEDIDTSKAADGLGDSFKRESGKAENYLDELAAAAQDAAEGQADAFEDAWDDVMDRARNASKKIKDDLDDIEDAAEDAGEEIEESLGGGFESLVTDYAQGVIGGIVSGVTEAVIDGAMDALKEVAEAAVEFGKEAIEISSDLEEVQNVVDTVFPNMATRVNSFAESALESAGLSELAAKQIIGQFGSMATAAGMTEEAAYDMATGLAQATGDVASFYNLSIDEAYEKLQAIFTGETEPLRRLGINMNEDALLAYALSEGLIDTTKSAEQLREETLALEKAQLNLEKAQANSQETLNDYSADSVEAREATLELQEANLELANAQAALNAESKPTLDNLKGITIEGLRYQFVMSRLEKAQGDFVKTQKSWANQTKILNEQWKEFQGTIGDVLKEAFSPFLQILNEEVLPGLQNFAEKFAEAMKPTPAEELNEYMRNMADSFASAEERFKGTAAELEANATVAEHLVERLEELEEAGVNNNVAAAEYEAIVEKLNELFPGLNAEIDKNTGFLKEGTQAIWDRIEALKEQAKQEAIQEYIEERYQLEIDAMAEIAEARAELAKLGGLEKVAIQKLAEQYGVSTDEMTARMNELYEFSKTSTQNTVDLYTGLGETFKWITFDPLTQEFVKLKDQQAELTTEIAKSQTAYDQLVDDNKRTIKALEDVTEEMEKTEEAQGDLSDSTGAMSSKVKSDFGNMADSAVDDMDRIAEKAKELNELLNPEFWGPNYFAGKSFANNWGTQNATGYTSYGLEESSIPALARGAVIPPNAPFTAILGDQRNGYNLEGPEDMFRGIVREELEASADSETAGLLRQLIAVVQGISIGDSVIGEAADRYNRKMNTARGVW